MFVLISYIYDIGGAAITCKNEIEKINEEGLHIVASQLKEVMVSGPSSSKSIGMDWSKRVETSDISLNLDEFGDRELMELSNFIVVHGAGYGDTMLLALQEFYCSLIVLLVLDSAFSPGDCIFFPIF